MVVDVSFRRFDVDDDAASDLKVAKVEKQQPLLAAEMRRSERHVDLKTFSDSDRQIDVDITAVEGRRKAFVFVVVVGFLPWQLEAENSDVRRYIIIIFIISTIIFVIAFTINAITAKAIIIIAIIVNLFIIIFIVIINVVVLIIINVVVIIIIITSSSIASPSHHRQ